MRFDHSPGTRVRRRPVPLLRAREARKQTEARAGSRRGRSLPPPLHAQQPCKQTHNISSSAPPQSAHLFGVGDHCLCAWRRRRGSRSSRSSLLGARGDDCAQHQQQPSRSLVRVLNKTARRHVLGHRACPKRGERERGRRVWARSLHPSWAAAAAGGGGSGARRRYRCTPPRCVAAAAAAASERVLPDPPSGHHVDEHQRASVHHRATTEGPQRPREVQKVTRGRAGGWLDLETDSCASGARVYLGLNLRQRETE